MLAAILHANLPDKHKVELAPLWVTLALLHEKTGETELSKRDVYDASPWNRTLTLERLKRLEIAELITLTDKHISIATARKACSSTARKACNSDELQGNLAIEESSLYSNARAEKDKRTTTTTTRENAPRETDIILNLVPFLQEYGAKLRERGYQGDTVFKWTGNAQMSADYLVRLPAFDGVDYETRESVLRTAISELFNKWYDDPATPKRYSGHFTNGLKAFILTLLRNEKPKPKQKGTTRTKTGPKERGLFNG